MGDKEPLDPIERMTPWTSLMTFMAFLLTFFLPGIFNNNILGNILFQDAIILTFVVMLLNYYGVPFIALGMHRLAYMEYIIATAAAVMVIGVDYLVSSATSDYFASANDNIEKMLELLKPDNFGQTVVLAVEMIIISTFLDEILFRGMIFNGFRRMGFFLAALITSVLMAALYSLTNLSFVAFIPAFFLSFIMCLLYARTRNLGTPLLAHLLINAVFFCEVAGYINLP